MALGTLFSPAYLQTYIIYAHMHAERKAKEQKENMFSFITLLVEGSGGKRNGMVGGLDEGWNESLRGILGGFGKD